MAKQVINRSYLETLSYQDLLVLADSYGIDVPENFNHTFLITELLDVVEEISKPSDTMTISPLVSSDSQWPPVYNTTEMDAIICNPAWAFVFWSINDVELERIKDDFGQLFLRICSYQDKNEEKLQDAYTMQISYTDREKYILLPKGKEYVKIELLLNSDGIEDVLASGPLLEVPKIPKSLINIKIGDYGTFSTAMELSGIKNLLLNHYKQHRQSFS